MFREEKKDRDREAKTSRARIAFEELRSLLSEEDLEEIAESSREF